MWLSYAPIPNYTARYYNVAVSDVDWFSVVYFIVSLVVGFVSIGVLDTFGLRVSVSGHSGTPLIRTPQREAPFDNKETPCAFPNTTSPCLPPSSPLLSPFSPMHPHAAVSWCWTQPHRFRNPLCEHRPPHRVLHRLLQVGVHGGHDWPIPNSLRSAIHAICTHQTGLILVWSQGESHLYQLCLHRYIYAHVHVHQILLYCEFIQLYMHVVHMLKVYEIFFTHAQLIRLGLQ